MYKLVLNGNIIDLSESEKITASKAVNFLSDLETRQSNYTNTFTLLKSKKNISVLGNSDIVQSGSNIAYTKIKAELYSNDVILLDGYAELEECEENYKITIYDGNYTFFYDLKDKSIRDLDLSIYDTVTKYSDIISSQTNQSGIIFPVVDYSIDGAYMTNSSVSVDTRTLRAKIFYKTIFDKIFITYGWTYSGDLDDIFTKLLVSLSNDTYFNVDVKNDDVQIIDLGTITPVNTILDEIVENTANSWTNFERLVAEIESVYSARFECIINTYSNETPIYFFINKYNSSNVFIQEYARTQVEGLGGFNLSADIPMNEGDYIQIFAQRTIAPLNQPFEYEQSKLYVTATNGVYKMNLSLPDLTQSDFVKIICNLTGLTPISDIYTKNVDFVSMINIFKNKQNAIDLSDKLDLSNKISIKFKNNNYGQKNYFKYENDQTIDDKYYSSFINCNNENLQPEKDVIVIPFSSAKAKVRLIGEVVPYIPLLRSGVVEGSYKYWLSLSNLVQKDLNFTNISQNTLSYGNIPTLSDLDFANLITKYYPDFTSIFQNYKEVECFINISEYEFYTYDFRRPVYISYFNSYFYVNEISNFISGKSTLFKLLKI
jgi:hypothetical protein